MLILIKLDYEMQQKQLQDLLKEFKHMLNYVQDQLQFYVKIAPDCTISEFKEFQEKLIKFNLDCKVENL